MADPAIPITCEGLAGHLAGKLTPLAVSAFSALGLAEDFSGLVICPDALPGQDGVWYRLRPGAGKKDLPILVLFCHPEGWQDGGRVLDAVLPPKPVWEQAPAPQGDSEGATASLNPQKAAIFLHHNLLGARDLVRGRIRGRSLPANLAEAFAEAWAVGIDGRLARWGLPGYPLAERRANFARLFSPAGILLPDHWQVFQALWDGALAEQKEVLEVVKRLPGL